MVQLQMNALESLASDLFLQACQDVQDSVELRGIDQEIQLNWHYLRWLQHWKEVQDEAEANLAHIVVHQGLTR